MIKNLLCSLPLPVKIIISTLKTYLDKKKNCIKTIDQFSDDNYCEINTKNIEET